MSQVNLDNLETDWDDNTLQFVFETPLSGEQRQELANKVAEFLNLVFDDSFESYIVSVNTDDNEAYLYGCETFLFKDKP